MNSRSPGGTKGNLSILWCENSNPTIAPSSSRASQTRQRAIPRRHRGDEHGCGIPMSATLLTRSRGSGPGPEVTAGRNRSRSGRLPQRLKLLPYRSGSSAGTVRTASGGPAGDARRASGAGHRPGSNREAPEMIWYVSALGGNSARQPAISCGLAGEGRVSRESSRLEEGWRDWQEAGKVFPSSGERADCFLEPPDRLGQSPRAATAGAGAAHSDGAQAMSLLLCRQRCILLACSFMCSSDHHEDPAIFRTPWRVQRLPTRMPDDLVFKRLASGRSSIHLGQDLRRSDEPAT